MKKYKYKDDNMVYGNITSLKDKKISRIVLGRSDLDGRDKVASFKFLDEMYSLGINTFDTAAIYQNYSEAVITEWIAERGIHDDAVILSKCGHFNYWRNRVHDFDIKADIADFLAKPGADYVDIYMLHRDDETVAVSEIINCFNELLDKGYIKTFGASNWSFERLLEANEYAYKKGLTPFTSISPQFSLAEQQGDLWPGTLSITGPDHLNERLYYEKVQMPIFSYSSIARGFLSGRFSSADDPNKAKNILDADIYRAFMCNSNLERLKRVEHLATQKEVSVATLSLAWVLNQPFNLFAIISSKSKERMTENIQALNVSLSAEELKWLNLESE